MRGFFTVSGHAMISAEAADQALNMLALDRFSLDGMGRRILDTLATAVCEESSAALRKECVAAAW